MKNPLVVLAISAIATFAMGWFGHRVFIKSTAPKTEPVQRAEPVKKTDSAPSPAPDTLFAQKKDSLLIQPGKKEADHDKPTVILASATTDTLWNDEREIVLKYPDGTVDIRRRFILKKTFDDYAVKEKFNGKLPKKLNYSTAKYARLYKTATQKAVEKKVLFAGRYVFSIIECGADCFASTVVDLKTGNVYDGPHASTGYKFEADSRMLIVNPVAKDGFYTPCEFCEPEVYVWAGKEFKRVQ